MIKQQILDYAKGLGFDKVGFSQNAVVVLLPYFVENEDGNVSMYARGVDYHKVAEEKLGRLGEFLKTLGAKEIFIHVDKGGLDDRRAAYDAGLGFLGKNGMLICGEFGSYFFIGQVVHDLEIQSDVPQKKGCVSCGECIRNCPGGALSEGGFDIEKCLSHITQKRGDLTEREKLLIKENGLCWGCDVCQRVCPHNKGLKTTALSEFMTDRIAFLEPDAVENLSNREFKEKFDKYAFSWRGKGVVERNLKVLFSALEDMDEKE